MSKLEVLTAPDPRLSTKAKPVDAVNDNVRKFMDDMLETMYADHGVGLAANQVGVLQRIIVLDLKDDDDNERPKGFYPLFLANPEILETSEEMVEAEEGCLSVPGQRISVTRPEKIKVRFLNYHNEAQEIETGGWLARALQHEIDHLDGKLTFDYLSKLKKSVVLRKLAKTKKVL
ncbi:MAG: peptide deformylase [Rickettsiaceae bacterium]|nr:peptide deformylase [Rickettsiaceae bacterium]